MAFKCPEMVLETSVNPGSGNYVLAGATGGYRAFVNELSAADTCPVTVYDNSNPPAYAKYICTFRTGPNRLERTVFLGSSTGTDITWGGGATVNVVSSLQGGVIKTFIDPALTTGYVKLTSGTPNSISTQATPIPVADGGTNATTTSAARTSLGVAIGTNVQAWDADLDTIAALAKTSGFFIIANGSAWTSRQPAGTDVTFDNSASSLPASPSQVQAAIDAAVIKFLRPYSKTVQSASQNITTTGITAFSDLDNLSIPGTGDSAKVYMVEGQVALNNLGAGTNRITIKVHVGTAGTTADAVIASAIQQVPNVGSDGWTFPVPPISFIPGASDKVTISVTSPDESNYDVMTGTGQTFLIIREISNV